MGFVMPTLGTAYGHVLSITAYSLGVIVFTFTLFGVIDRMQAKIVQKNEELEAINSVSRVVTGSLDIERTLQQALEKIIGISGSAAGTIVIHGQGSQQLRSVRVGDRDALDRLEAYDTCKTHKADMMGLPGDGIIEVPLTSLGEEIGVMRLLTNEDMSTDGRNDDALLTGIGDQLALAVTAGLLHEDVLRRQVNSQALYEIAIDITSAQDPKDVLWSIVERARELLNAESANLCLYDEAASNVSVFVHSECGDHIRSPRETDFLEPAPASGQTGRIGCPLLARTGRLCAPLKIGNERIGALCIAGPGPGNLNDEDQHLLAGIADLAAIAVQKSRLLERSHRAAVLEEREWLAREMHDSLAQVLGYLHLQSQTALAKLSPEALPEVEDELREMAQLAKEGYTDVREAILGLRERVRECEDFVAALREYAQKFSHRAGISADVEVDGDTAVQLSAEAQVQVIRVVQEALTNVRKHAEARRARIRLEQTDRLTITIEDDGKGFEPKLLLNDGSRFGLWTMRERAERIGGLVEVDSAPGRGTCVRVVIPAQRGDQL